MFMAYLPEVDEARYVTSGPRRKAHADTLMINASCISILRIDISIKETRIV
jgi:hypothetical protein